MSKANGQKWEKYFSKLYDDPARPNLDPSSPPSDQTTCNPINGRYTTEELDVTILKLKTKKAAGKDKLLAEFIKASEEQTHQLLLRMINTLYSTNIVPKSWCLSIITPIHKEGPKDDPDNYRGIALISCLAKFFYSILNNRLMDFCLRNKII